MVLIARIDEHSETDTIIPVNSTELRTSDTNGCLSPVIAEVKVKPYD